MAQNCQHCGIRRASKRSGFKYCGDCYLHLCSYEAQLGRIPAYDPFMREREQRIQRLMARAEQRLPLFEK